MSLGLGNSLSKGGTSGPTIVTDGLVLKHQYDAGAVVPVSDGAVKLNGATEYITIDGLAGELETDDAFTFSLWFMSTGAVTGSGHGAEMLLSGHKADDTNTFRFGLNSSSSGTTLGGFIIDSDDPAIASFLVHDNADDGSGTSYFDSKWHHVAITRAGGSGNQNTSIYLDGVLLKYVYISDGTSQSTNGVFDRDSFEWDDVTKFSIGQEWDATATATDFFKGYMCNVGVWNAALTQAQIKSIMWKNYSNLTSSEKTNLVSWWNLDSNIGDTTSGVPTGAAHVYDNHHGGGESLGSEIISNTTFDNNITGWVDYNTGTVSHETSIVYSGNGALRTTNDGTGNRWLGRYPSGNIPGIEANTSYLVTGRAYIPTGWDGGHLYFTDGSSFGGDESFIKADSSTLDQWQETTMVVDTASDITGSLYLRCASNPSADKYVIWDSISMKKINGNTGVCK